MSGEQGPHAEGKGMRANENAPSGRRAAGRIAQHAEEATA